MKKTEYTCDWCREEIKNYDPEKGECKQHNNDDLTHFHALTLWRHYKLDHLHTDCVKWIKKHFDKFIKEAKR